MGSRALVAAAAVVLVLSASACGGGRKSTSTTSTTTGSSATLQWAGSVCSSFTTWKKTLEGIKTGLGGGGIDSLNSTALKRAASQAGDATKTLVRSLKRLGPPETVDVWTAKQNVAALDASLSQGVTQIENAVKSSDRSVAGAATALPIVAAQLRTMANALKDAVDSLNQIEDPVSSDLEQAFQQSPACSAYVSS